MPDPTDGRGRRAILASPVARALAVLGRAVRAAWLLAGVILALAGAVAAVERIAVGWRARSAGSQEAPPIADWKELRRDLDARRDEVDVYRGHHSLPLTTRLVNVDSAGERVTPQRWSDAPREVLMLGGSAMWGAAAPDSGTIPAYTAFALESGAEPVTVRSLAQPGFNFTQEAVTLTLEILAGRIPAAVVFLNGEADVATARRYGDPGHTLNEAEVERRLDLGRRRFLAEVRGLPRHLLTLGPPAAGRRPEADSAICVPTARYYVHLAAAVEALGVTYGFPVFFFLQPHPATTRKPRSRWEAGLGTDRVTGRCLAAIDSAMAARAGPSFHSLSRLFDRDSATVFVDEAGTLTPAANRRVADRIAETIRGALTRPPVGVAVR